MDLLEYINSKYDGDGSGYGDGYGDGSGYGSGDGSGDGYGDGSSYGYGDGSGSGDGSGDGYGDGSGSGSGDGRAVAEFDGVKGYLIDGIRTYLEHIHGNVAKGFTLKRNYIKIPCYIYLTDDDFIAHGENLHEARSSAIEKSLQRRPIEERLREFVSTHPDINAEYGDLFSWHHILTGSCEYGRKQWCEIHGLEPTDSITVDRFITETVNDYGGEIIARLSDMYNKTLKN